MDPENIFRTAFIGQTVVKPVNTLFQLPKTYDIIINPVFRALNIRKIVITDFATRTVLLTREFNPPQNEVTLAIKIDNRTPSMTSAGVLVVANEGEVEVKYTGKLLVNRTISDLTTVTEN